MFERFTEKAIKVIMLAQEEMRRLGWNDVGVEAMYLGLIGEGTSIGAKALKRQGVNLRDARVTVEAKIGRGNIPASIEMPFTPEANKALHAAWDKSKELKCTYIGPEHLLLGLLDSVTDLIQSVDVEQLKKDISTLTTESKELGLRVAQSFALARALSTTIRELEMNLDVESFEKILKSEAFKKLVKKELKK